jgi:hypothetical protein
MVWKRKDGTEAEIQGELARLSFSEKDGALILNHSPDSGTFTCKGCGRTFVCGHKCGHCSPYAPWQPKEN